MKLLHLRFTRSLGKASADAVRRREGQQHPGDLHSPHTAPGASAGPAGSGLNLARLQLAQHFGRSGVQSPAGAATLLLAACLKKVRAQPWVPFPCLFFFFPKEESCAHL